MQIIFFSSDMDTINEWKERHDVEYSASCFDIQSLNEQLQKYEEYIIICDYDSVAHDINILISSNNLPSNCVLLERSPAIATGKMLISHGIKAYGNSRMLTHHYLQLIQTVIDGKTWTYPELTAAMVKIAKNASLNEEAKELLQRLTDKEHEVIYLVLNGLTNDAIAKEINITVRTVKAHITSIFSKLHVNDRISLVLLLK